MPSIFTHLIVAEDALEALPFGGLRQDLERQRHAYFLGALGPDLPYFDIFERYRGLPLGSFLGPVTQTVETRVLAWLGWSLPEQAGWSRELHSMGAMKQVMAWAAWARRRDPKLHAFFCGMATHVSADEVLHPKVNENGGVPDTVEGLRRHREIEISLDWVLLRSRGVALEGLNLGGLLESFLGRVGQEGEYLSPALKAAWVAAAHNQEQALHRGDLDTWSRGFAAAMRLLEHRLSPLQHQRERFAKGAEEQWRTYLAREGYLASHVPRASRAAHAVLNQLAGETIPPAAAVY